MEPERFLKLFTIAGALVCGSAGVYQIIEFLPTATLLSSPLAAVPLISTVGAAYGRMRYEDRVQTINKRIAASKTDRQPIMATTKGRMSAVSRGALGGALAGATGVLGVGAAIAASAGFTIGAMAGMGAESVMKSRPVRRILRRPTVECLDCQ